MQNQMRDETAITLISQCRYNKNLINDTKSGKFYQVNTDYNSFPTGSRKYYFLHKPKVWKAQNIYRLSQRANSGEYHSIFHSCNIWKNHN